MAPYVGVSYTELERKTTDHSWLQSKLAFDLVSLLQYPASSNQVCI